MAKKKQPIVDTDMIIEMLAEAKRRMEADSIGDIDRAHELVSSVLTTLQKIRGDQPVVPFG